uniref:Uncharacterized protein n=1 Tax=Eptatretus burgeri TaxID=7764 RepID=A0A8C4QNQ8_EPTBU
MVFVLAAGHISTCSTSDSLPQSLSSHRGAYRPAGCLRSKYPYSLAEVDLPPTISLSDGEEPPPYKGPCTLKLRAPEQQRELSREAIRAPPNRTVFDGACSPPLKARPLPPSTHAGASAATKHASGCGPPPPYSETISGFPPSVNQKQTTGPPNMSQANVQKYCQKTPT